MDADLAARCAEEAIARDLSVAGWLRAVAATAACFEPRHERRSKPRAKVKAKPSDVTRSLVRVLEQLKSISESHRRIAYSEGNNSPIAPDEWEALSKQMRGAAADLVAVIQELARQ
jgi:hypothetical protein